MKIVYRNTNETMQNAVSLNTGHLTTRDKNIHKFLADLICLASYSLAMDTEKLIVSKNPLIDKKDT